LTPENVTFVHSKLLLYNCTLHNIKDEHLSTTINKSGRGVVTHSDPAFVNGKPIQTARWKLSL